MKCPECGSENLFKKGFRNNKQRYRCKDCGRYFVEGTNFVGRQIKLPTAVKECPHCGNKKVYRDGLLADGTQRYKCLNCLKRFSSKTLILPPVEYTCPYCNGKLKRSGKGKLGQSEYKCTDCGKSCSGDPPKKLITFEQINTDISCPYCGEKKIKLAGHNKKGLVKYRCKTCEKSFTKETQNRLEAIENDPRSKEVCPHCGGTKIISAGKSKVGNQRYRCLVCRKTYTKGIPIPVVISNRDKKLILMYHFNLKVPVSQLAQHFNYSDYLVNKFIKQYRKAISHA